MKKQFMALAIGTSLLVSTAVIAGSSNDGHHHGHDDDHGSSNGHMMKGMDKPMSGDMSEQMSGHMREVMGEGRINKIMSDRHMVNIKHEPIPEMNWPKMRMNFKVGEGVDMGALKPGQMVDFTLLVDDDNNYVIKNINSK